MSQIAITIHRIGISTESAHYSYLETIEWQNEFQEIFAGFWKVALQKRKNNKQRASSPPPYLPPKRSIYLSMLMPITSKYIFNFTTSNTFSFFFNFLIRHNTHATNMVRIYFIHLFIDKYTMQKIK